MIRRPAVSRPRGARVPVEPFHPDLRLVRVLPRGTVGRRTLPLVRLAMRVPRPSTTSGVEHLRVPSGPALQVHGRDGGSRDERRPALVWIHGGGMVMGDAGQDAPFCARVARKLDAVVASVEYRLTPEHPFPAPLEDCYAALEWLAAQPDVDPARIAIGGASAGGGLAAGLALLARDRGEVRPALQLLVYPMIDDRTTLRTDIDPRRLRLWSPGSNRFGWQAYLGPALTPGQPDGVPAAAAPARATDLTGLPPAWIGVGSCDLFHDEDVAYAQRLQQAGVECTLEVVPGAYHGFDAVERRTAVARAFFDAQLRALASALGRPAPRGSVPSA